MADSDHSAEYKSTHVSAHTFTVVRAMISAAIFGTIGAAIGKWLGYRGKDSSSQMVKSVMTWSMGGFWATLAAYSSLKSSEREAQAGQNPPPDATVNGSASVAQAATSSDIEPANQIQVDAAEHRGAVQKFAPEMLTQK